MKKIEIRKKEFNVPESWFDVNLNMFLQIKELEKDIDKLELLEFNIKYMCILLNCEEDDLNVFTSADFTRMFKKLYEITSNEIPQLTSKKLILKGKRYVFDDISDNISLGQFIDIEMFLKEVNGEMWPALHRIAAVFLREGSPKNPFKHKYNKIRGKEIVSTDFNIKEYDTIDCLENSKIFYYELPMPWIIFVTAFFLSLEHLFTKAM